MKKILVKPLTEDEYATSFKYFSDRSHEYEVMLNFLIKHINKNNKKTIKILSIGAGTGYFDNMYIKKLDKK